MRKESILIVSFILLMLTGSWADGCPVEEMEVITAGIDLSEEEIDAAQAFYEMAQWEDLIDAISGLETGTLIERIALADEFYWDEYLHVLESPPGGDLGLVEYAVERLRGYVATEPRGWLVYQVGRDLWDVDVDEIAPLLFDLTSHPAPSVRAKAIDNLYNYLAPEDWTSWDNVERQLEELWSRETHPLAQTVLVEALAYYEVELPHQTLARLLTNGNDDLAEATVDYLAKVKPEGWINLLLREVTRGKEKHGQKAIMVLTPRDRGRYAKAEANRLRSFFEPRVDSARYDWARPEILTLLASLGSTLAETEIRELFWSSHAATAITGIDRLKRMDVSDWPACIARRALDGEVDIRERALYEIAELPWDPAFDAVVRRVASESESSQLAFAAWVALGTPADPSSDRSHLIDLWKQLGQRHKNLNEKNLLPAAAEAAVDRAGEPDGFDFDVTHIVAAPPGQQTVRCFAAPDCEGPPEKAQRVPTGHPISGERFDDVDAVWLEVEPIANDSCWVNASYAVSRDEYQSAEPETDAKREVDVARATLRVPNFIQLKKFKVLETFDVGRSLAGCRLIVDVRDSERMERLRKATGLRQTNLAHGVRQLFPEIESTYGSLDGWEAWAEARTNEGD